MGDERERKGKKKKIKKNNNIIKRKNLVSYHQIVQF